MSEELSNIAIEASVWDLEATCPYYKVFENLAASAKKTVPIVAMKCLKTQSQSFSFSSNSTTRQTMAFYLGTYTGCIGVVEITSFWSHTEGKKCPSRLHLRFSSKGPILKLKCMLKMWSRRLTRNLTYMINFMVRRGNGDIVMASGEPATSGTDEKHEVGLFQKIADV
ncbi:hypothetical protein CMV_029594 [Castanea mollissima]|uniref:Uncharacterized protein n=1 Tax=Castanea mollissima TaxID=60419 RepID=A0A8J4QE77_9ROSI|nr:hypothetical protein CMV_029594 [Castanea mollissima]